MFGVNLCTGRQGPVPQPHTNSHIPTYVRLALLHREAQGLRGQERVDGVDGAQQLVHDLGRHHAVRRGPPWVDKGVEVPARW